MFLYIKGLNAQDIHKEIFPVYGGKCLLRKAFHNWVEKFSHRRSKIADDERLHVEVAETTDKRLLCCGFRRTIKATGQVYQCLWRICQEINVFSRFEYHMFYSLSICGLFTGSPLYILRFCFRDAEKHVNPPKSKKFPQDYVYGVKLL
jgi:hypothetical protein